MRLPEHTARLLETCRIMGIPIACGKDDLDRACVETVRRNPRRHRAEDQRPDPLH